MLNSLSYTGWSQTSLDSSMESVVWSAQNVFEEDTEIYNLII